MQVSAPIVKNRDALQCDFQSRLLSFMKLAQHCLVFADNMLSKFWNPAFDAATCHPAAINAGGAFWINRQQCAVTLWWQQQRENRGKCNQQIQFIAFIPTHLAKFRKILKSQKHKRDGSNHKAQTQSHLVCVECSVDMT